MHLRNLEDFFYIDKVLEEGGVFLWRRRHSEPSTDTCINPYIVLNVRVGFGKFQQIAEIHSIEILFKRIQNCFKNPMNP